MLKRTTIYTREVSEEIDLSQNPNLMMKILEGFTKYDQNQIEKRALLKTASQPLIEEEESISDQEEELKVQDIKADNWEYRKRKNPYILGEAPEDNRKGHKRIRRKKLVVQSDSEEEELTFEEEEIILID